MEYYKMVGSLLKNSTMNESVALVNGLLASTFVIHKMSIMSGISKISLVYSNKLPI